MTLDILLAANKIASPRKTATPDGQMPFLAASISSKYPQIALRTVPGQPKIVATGRQLNSVGDKFSFSTYRQSPERQTGKWWPRDCTGRRGTRSSTSSSRVFLLGRRQTTIQRGPPVDVLGRSPLVWIRTDWKTDSFESLFKRKSQLNPQNTIPNVLIRHANALRHGCYKQLIHNFGYKIGQFCLSCKFRNLKMKLQESVCRR